MKNQRNTTKRVALYARVSTLDKGQDPETQLVQLRQYAQARNFEVITEFIDYASGTSEDRTQYKLMMAAAKKRKIDVVLVWRYDRFARSTQALVNALVERAKRSYRQTKTTSIFPFLAAAIINLYCVLSSLVPEA